MVAGPSHVLDKTDKATISRFHKEVSMDPDDMDKLAARYAPILKFAKGEIFFPMDVRDYVSKCSLHTWMEPDKHHMRVPPGLLTLENMIQWPDREHFLVYAEEKYLAPAAPGLVSQTVRRLVDLTRPIDAASEAIRKLVRGTTDGALPGPFKKAKEHYQQSAREPVIYYRILDKHQRGGNYDIIQYFFFYAFNDWATSHKGVNDHEADWERVCVFFHDFKDARPVGVTYSAHSEHFCKSWEEVFDDVEKRPVVYVDGGSHANLPSPDIWTGQSGANLSELFHDFVRRGLDLSWEPGDVVIGFSDEGRWQVPRLECLPDVDPTEAQDWVNSFRGMWGARYYWRTSWIIRLLFWLLKLVRTTERPGRAPGGPMYDNNGEVREDWLNPEVIFRI
jgi:hypothetical protein